MERQGTLTRKALLGASAGMAATVALNTRTGAALAKAGSAGSVTPDVPLLPSDRIGIHLYSVRDAVSEVGFASVLQALAKIGYKNVEFAGYSFLLNAGERQIDAGTAAMLVSLGPILIALLAGVLLGEGYPRGLYLGCAIAFGGVALIGAAGSGDGRSGGWGTVLCLAAALCYAGAVIAQKIALRTVGILQLNFLCAVVATLALLPATPSLSRDLGDAPSSSIAWVVYLGAFPMALAFTTWAYALARTSAGRLASTTYLVPAISILLGWAFLGETPAALAFLGGAICIAGVAAARRRA